MDTSMLQKIPGLLDDLRKNPNPGSHILKVIHDFGPKTRASVPDENTAQNLMISLSGKALDQLLTDNPGLPGANLFGALCCILNEDAYGQKYAACQRDFPNGDDVVAGSVELMRQQDFYGKITPLLVWSALTYVAEADDRIDLVHYALLRALLLERDNGAKLESGETILLVQLAVCSEFETWINKSLGTAAKQPLASVSKQPLASTVSQPAASSAAPSEPAPSRDLPEPSGNFEVVNDLKKIYLFTYIPLGLILLSIIYMFKSNFGVGLVLVLGLSLVTLFILKTIIPKLYFNCDQMTVRNCDVKQILDTVDQTCTSKGWKKVRGEGQVNYQKTAMAGMMATPVVSVGINQDDQNYSTLQVAVTNGVYDKYGSLKKGETGVKMRQEILENIKRFAV